MTPTMYLLACHNPVVLPGNPHPACASVWPANALLDEQLPPDASRLYRLVSEPHWRRDGDVIPISTVAAELDGNLDTVLTGWASVIDQLLHLTLTHQIDALPLSLAQHRWELLMSPPTGQLNIITTAGSTIAGGQERSDLLRSIANHLHHTVIDSGPLAGSQRMAAPSDWTPPTMRQIAHS
jgi:hypothetical protein